MKKFLCEIERDGQRQRIIVHYNTAEQAWADLSKTCKVFNVEEIYTL